MRVQRVESGWPRPFVSSSINLKLTEMQKRKRVSQFRRCRISRGSRWTSTLCRRETAVLLNAKKCVRDISRFGRCGLSSSQTFTGLLKSICRDYFIIAPSCIDRRNIRCTFTAITSGRIQEAFIQEKKDFLKLLSQKTWHEWRISVKIFSTNFRLSVGGIIKFKLNSCNREILRTINSCQ